MKEKLEKLRALLKEVEEISSYLTINGVVLDYTVGTDQKTVQIKSKSSLEITVVATINQEL